MSWFGVEFRQLDSRALPSDRCITWQRYAVRTVKINDARGVLEVTLNLYVNLCNVSFWCRLAELLEDMAEAFDDRQLDDPDAEEDDEDEEDDDQDDGDEQDDDDEDDDEQDDEDDQGDTNAPGLKYLMGDIKDDAEDAAEDFEPDDDDEDEDEVADDDDDDDDDDGEDFEHVEDDDEDDEDEEEEDDEPTAKKRKVWFVFRLCAIVVVTLVHQFQALCHYFHIKFGRFDDSVNYNLSSWLMQVSFGMWECQESESWIGLFQN